jgi:lysyl-tRNA synthetase class 2
MATLTELRQVRMEKLELLKNAGMEAYPVSVTRTHSLQTIRDSFSGLESSKDMISAVGRILSLRGQGAIMFVTLFDGTEKFQAVFKKDEIEESLFKLFSDAVDLGDFIQVTGTLFTTQKGAPSILVTSWTMATKAL